MGSKGDREFLEAIRQLSGKPVMPLDHHDRVIERINRIPLVPDVLLSGKWKGYAERRIEEGEVVPLPNKTEFVAPKAMSYGYTTYMTLEVKGGHISGRMIQFFNLRRLGWDKTIEVHGTITGTVIRNDDISLHFENTQDPEHWIDIAVYPNKHWKGLEGDYQGQGFLTHKPIKGYKYFVKVEEFTDPGGDDSSPEKREELARPTFNMEALRTISSRHADRSSELVREARTSILVTHFSPEVPSEEYIKILLHKMQHIPVTRIVHYREGGNYNWLRHFRRDDGQLPPSYTEYVYMAGTPTPIDFVIIDNKKVLLALPKSAEVPEFFDTVETEDIGFIATCNTVYSMLLLNSEKVDAAKSDPAIARAIPRYL